MAEQLIAAGAALDVQNNEGYGRCADCHGFTLFQTGSRLLGRNAAVILAAMNGHTPVVEQLIAGGAKLDVQNIEGYGPCSDCNGLALYKTGSRLLGRSTALILAALKGHTLITEQLIAAGAGLDHRNTKG